MTDLQPYLHDQVVLVASPLQVWSRANGDIDNATVGVVFSDVQLVSGLRLRLDGHTPAPLGYRADTSSANFFSIPRHLQDETVTGGEPRVVLTRTRSITVNSLEERIHLDSTLIEPIDTTIELEVSTSATPIDQVKRGGVLAATVLIQGNTATWHDETVSVTLTSQGTPLEQGGPHRLLLRETLRVPPGGSAIVTLLLSLDSPSGNTPFVPAALTTPVVAAPPAAEPPSTLVWRQQSLDDLHSLRLEHRLLSGQPFFAAGAPWYLTLFGRDSLWTATLLRAVDPDMALSTLHVLASQQGSRLDPVTEEAPGKILHELRSQGFTALPARYYGSIDSTSLWVNLLVELWEAGDLPDTDITLLLPALTAALDWITGPADTDGDGFAEYTRPAGRRGLVNQGWKDSPTSILFADGTIAEGPIALTEVQGYAHQAARHSAALLRYAGLDPDRYLTWADQLRSKFHQQFMLPDGLPALALDGHKNRVDATTSNIGHLLGTDLLDHDQEAAIADRLTQPDMSSGFGLRTMSTNDGGYRPLSYHCGSVWAHDTAIVIAGMLKADLPHQARHLAEGLHAAAAMFDNRLPELWSGHPQPLPYPGACRPQAWAAAAAIPAQQALATT